MAHIDREDMLELTRRMNLERNCFTRIAGAYMDEDGYEDGSFNTSFLKLSTKEKREKIEIAKAIPFAKTNIELKDYRFDKEEKKPGGIRQLLMAINQYECKNDDLMETFYNYVGERLTPGKPYAILVYQGIYDVPKKASDKENLWESEEVYQFLICAVCDTYEDYKVGKPACGFLFPTFTNRTADVDGIAVFESGDFDYSYWKERVLFPDRYFGPED